MKPADPRFPTTLPNGPFNLETYVPPTNTIGDLGDGFYQEQMAIDGGRMDKFVATDGVGALPMGYYDATPLPLGQLAKTYTLDDNFFHAAFGTSMLNHFWLISAATPGLAGRSGIHESGPRPQRPTRQGRGRSHPTAIWSTPPTRPTGRTRQPRPPACWFRR